MSEFPSYNPEYDEATEILCPEVTASPIEITKKEKKRYGENHKFGEAIYKEIIDLVDNESDLSEEYIEKKTEEISENLSEPQKKVLNQAIEKFKKELQEIQKKEPQENMEFFYESMKKTKGFKNIIDQIRESDVEINGLGAVVVRVKDIGLWYSLTGGKWEWKGYKLVVPEEMDAFEEDIDEEEREQIRNLLNKVVFVKDYQVGDEDKIDPEQVVQHEVFHVVYKMLFLDTRTSYGEKEKQQEKLFLEIKDELLAYCFEEEWQDDFFAYFKKEISENLQKDKTDQINTNDLFDYIEKSAGNSFARECKLFVRQIKRLKLLESKDFEEVIKVVMATQDLKEIIYNLSKIEEDGVLDIETILFSGPEDLGLSNETLNKVYNLATAMCTWRIPCRGSEKLIDYIEQVEESIKHKPRRLSFPGMAERLKELLSWKTFIKENRQKIIER